MNDDRPDFGVAAAVLFALALAAVIAGLCLGVW